MIHQKYFKKIEKTAEEIKEKVEKSRKSFFREFKTQTAVAITAGFAFLIALVWKDAINGVINKIVEKLQIPQSLYFYQILMAVFITILCVVGIIFIKKWASKGNDKSENND
ncbi:hypothetical protein CO154_00615 [Candidatus Pacearchaeota archaeon CG_4_9_14_3_um_filter_31_7]|nr:MAG: hypothetical protein AUJ10_03390 [Candidatus Pacearchaeota archaeon CG1_02_31_27]PIN92451.1 MAG: hypothetical protein COU55_01455 [Candidatus Pacearchaeota archaeon CG10_big_fil_rev_8_21_14_0_10_31_59]PIZ81036.1 MAG: hypothetical protein COX99_01155 [Candidatus Pacearchaeota archaeon CG_4_10_14_0_2_um_filter_31_10]PJA70868.1 MAG: hypothetical protein CO154_00615 [Candidatus Pacearchaeota archaeon CG_4_9_14_3_um_filter_31_7]